MGGAGGYVMSGPSIMQCGTAYKGAESINCARPFVPCSCVGHSASSESSGASVRHK